MEQKTIPCSMAPEIMIDEVMGNLQIKGWENPEIQLRADPENISVKEEDEIIRLRVKSDVSIRVPAASTIQIGQVYGDVRIKMLGDQLSLSQVNGNLVLRSVGNVTVGQVNGELIARQVAGDLAVEQVNGNANLRESGGRCTLKQVNGNLDAQFIAGSIQADVDGNARFKFTQLKGEHYEVHADGNLYVDLPDDANVSMKLASESNLIRVFLPGNSQTLRQSDYELILGEGQTNMVLSASGIVSISGVENRWEGPGSIDENYEPFIGLPEDFGERIANQVESQIETQMEMMTRQMNDQLARMTAAFDRYGMGSDEADRIMQDTRQKSERAAEQAEEKMRRAQEKLEKKMETYHRRAQAQSEAAERRAKAASRRGWRFEWAPPPKPPVPPARVGVSEEERLMILKMLEEKKISLDEAARLLEALEGKA
jgi:hypothetical protein